MSPDDLRLAPHRTTDEGFVDPLVGQTLPLEEALRAPAAPASRSVVGNVVLRP